MHRQRITALVAALLAAVFVVGCGPTVGALQQAGFRQVSVTDNVGSDTMEVQLGGIPRAQSSSAIAKAQRVVWKHTTGRFKKLTVETAPGSWGDDLDDDDGQHQSDPDPDTVVSKTTTYAKLQQRFGPRDPKLEQDESLDAGTLVVIVLGSLLFVLVAVAVTVWLVLRRNRRNHRERSAPGRRPAPVQPYGPSYQQPSPGEQYRPGDRPPGMY